MHELGKGLRAVSYICRSWDLEGPLNIYFSPRKCYKNSKHCGQVSFYILWQNLYPTNPGWLSVFLLPLYQVADHKGWGGGVLRASWKYGNFCHQPPSACNLYSLCCRGGGWTLQQQGGTLQQEQRGRGAPPIRRLAGCSIVGPALGLVPIADGGSVPPPPPHLPLHGTRGESRDQRLKLVTMQREWVLVIFSSCSLCPPTALHSQQKKKQIP